MLPSERYYELTQKRHVFNIMPIANIPSVLEHGVVCFNMMQQIKHSSIAMNEVQARRALVEIPNGLSLHQYANLYFSYRNPMLYARQAIVEDLCVLALRSTVLDIDGCVVSDRNAAVGLARFYEPTEGLERLNFDLIHARYWTDPNEFQKRDKKAIKCAEILIPHSVPSQYIVGACVVNEAAEEKMIAQGFNKKIQINADAFFR